MRHVTKRVTAMALAAMMVLSLAACGEKPAESTAAPAAENGAATEAAETEAAGAAEAEIKLIAAHVNNTESSFQYGMEQFKKNLEEVSGGKMTVEIHPNGELGGDESELIEKVATGTVDVIVVSPADLSNAVPAVDFLGLPFVFENVDHWKKSIQDERVGGFFKNCVNEGGAFRALTYYMCGIRDVFSPNPIESLEDMAGKKIRVKGSANVVRVWSDLGAQPTSLAYNEVYSGLQNNVIDAAENDIANIMSMKFYEPAPYVTMSQHDYATRFLVISQNKYNSLTDEQKAWVDEAAEASSEPQWEYDQNYAEECKAQLEADGTTFIDINTEEWITKVEPSLVEIADSLGVASAYEAIQENKQ